MKTYLVCYSWESHGFEGHGDHYFAIPRAVGLTAKEIERARNEILDDLHRKVDDGGSPIVVAFTNWIEVAGPPPG